MADLNRLHDMRSLDRSEAYGIMNDMISGALSEVHLSATLASLNHRELQLDEILGFRDAMLEHCARIDLGGAACMDFCGTGGDGKDTFNISTTTAILLGAMGIPVVKHGNYGVSSSCGSSNVLEAIGYRFPTTPDEVVARFERHGTVFLHAPFFHPAMRNVGPVRKALGVRTLFNIMGPLDGHDEISLTSDVRVFSTRNHFHLLSCSDFGAEGVQPSAIQGADSLEGNGALLQDILGGRGTAAQRRVVAANAALALVVWNPEHTLAAAYQQALDMLDSGRAALHLQTLLAP